MNASRPSPLQNRVDPYGHLHAVASKACTLMGNRGSLHDSGAEVVRKWARKAWVSCDPHFKGINRKPLFQEGKYSELFFLDEATALAAGHRPCNYCQRDRYQAFMKFWALGNMPDTDSTRPLAGFVDEKLHAERAVSRKDAPPSRQSLADLPDGVIVELSGHAYLWLGGRLLTWTHMGYEGGPMLTSNAEVMLVTPDSIVRAILAGYTVRVHPTAK